jgi:cytochrome c oxidase assembly protein subunit 11
MKATNDQHTKQLAGRHRLVAGVLVAVFAGMVGAAYAAVPIYKLICQATGLNGTTQRVGANGVKILDRKITVHFDSNTGADMPWEFKPLQRDLTVRIGETSMAYFSAYNPTGKTISGNATFNVTPEIAGRFFDKIQCFCFNQQTLKAGERVEMPVVFFVDPAIVTEPGAEDIHDITLSYTFFATPDGPAPAVAASPITKPTKGS